MGYAEYGGDGSVKWATKQDDGGHHTSTDKGSKPDGNFYVYVEGKLVATVKQKKKPRQVVVTWDPDTIDSLPEAASPKD